MRSSDRYDVVGLGFGPANLALAIALQERSEAPSARFAERQPRLGWHRGMLVPSAKMQVSFLKDLVTFRNPQSPFSYVSYLHARDRLARFANKHDFFATREEFHDYLDWAASAFENVVDYATEAVGIRVPATSVPGEAIDELLVDLRHGGPGGPLHTVRAHNVVVSTGLVPRMPPDVDRSDRVWHSSEFLLRLAECDAPSVRRVVVVGAGQSAAEIVRFLHDQLPLASVQAVLPAYGYSIADNTPFANEVFDPAAVDVHHGGTQDARDAIWNYHRNTNYSVVDDEVIRDLYARAYDDEVRGSGRLEFANLSRVVRVDDTAEGADVTVHSTVTGMTTTSRADVVVFATGYEPMSAAPLLGEVERFCRRDDDGRYRMERDYRIATAPVLRCGIYLQGGTEHSHGLASSLLSNLAMRAGDIAESVGRRVRSTGARPEPAVPVRWAG